MQNNTHTHACLPLSPAGPTAAGHAQPVLLLLHCCHSPPPPFPAAPPPADNGGDDRAAAPAPNSASRPRPRRALGGAGAVVGPRGAGRRRPCWPWCDGRRSARGRRAWDVGCSVFFGGGFVVDMMTCCCFFLVVVVGGGVGGCKKRGRAKWRQQGRTEQGRGGERKARTRSFNKNTNTGKAHAPGSVRLSHFFLHS